MNSAFISSEEFWRSQNIWDSEAKKPPPQKRLRDPPKMLLRLGKTILRPTFFQELFYTPNFVSKWEWIRRLMDDNKNSYILLLMSSCLTSYSFTKDVSVTLNSFILLHEKDCIYQTMLSDTWSLHLQSKYPTLPKLRSNSPLQQEYKWWSKARGFALGRCWSFEFIDWCIIDLVMVLKAPWYIGNRVRNYSVCTRI